MGGGKKDLGRICLLSDGWFLVKESTGDSGISN